MDDLFGLVILDVVCVGAFLALLYRRLTFAHPATVYLFFHVYAFSIRLVGLALGDVPLYGDVLAFRMIDSGEIARAIIVADIALILFGLGVLCAPSRPRAKVSRLELNPRKVLYIVVFFLLAGMPFFLLTRNSAEIFGAGEQLYKVFSMWPIGALCLAIHVWGFRWYLLVGLGALLIVVSLQGYHRFMMVLPMIFLMSSYLAQRNLRWPNQRVALIGLLLVLLFPQLKYIGMAYQAGDAQEISHRIRQAFLLVEQDAQAKSTFLDQFAGALTLSDEFGTRYFGETYLSAITLFIPRAIWPDKPGLGDHTIAMATQDRPYDKEGRIITYLGEAYVNFGYVGIVLIPFVLAWVLTRWFCLALSGGSRSVAMYVYLAVMVSFIQVYRDGVTSLFLFGVIQNVPMLAVYVFHKFAWSTQGGYPGQR